MRLPSLRRTAGLSALALALPLAAYAATPAAGAPAPASVATAVSLPTSWPAVPVEQRLQPWLAERLAAPSVDRLTVMVSGQTTEAATAAVRAAGLTALQTWSKVGIVVGAGTPAQVRAVVQQPGVTYVEGDQPLQYALDTAHAATRSDEARTTYKASDGSVVDGSGFSIAVIDSGIDGTHPMFRQDGVSKVVRNMKNVCGATLLPSINESCFQHQPSNDTDTFSAGGHGTHVAGIAAGYPVTTTTPEQVPLRGSGSDAKLVGLSVGAAIGLLDANSAMSWVVDHQRKPCAPAAAQDEGEIDPACPPIRVTNHSYGPISTDDEGTAYDDKSATVRIQRALVALGVTPVWAAGNDGGDGSVNRTNPPGMDPTPGVLMVASYNDGQNGNRDNQLSGFSSRGTAGDPTTYPDLSAPGDLITSACRPSLAVCQGAPSYDGGNYQTISGTSMAAPYVAGVVAQMVELRPSITPGEIEDLLEDTAHKFDTGAAYGPDPRNPDDTSSFDKGHGLVDVLAVLAKQQGLPAPGGRPKICTATSRQVVDPAGDATQFVVVDTPGPSQPDLDIRAGWLTWDDTAKALTFHITVTNLNGGTGDEYFRFYVTRESDAEIYAVANRDATGESFSVKQYDTGTSTTVTGVFDEPANEVRIVLPADQYDEVIPDATLAVGDRIGVGQILGQRDTGVVTATADIAAGSCPYTVAPSTTTSPTSPGASASPSGSASPSASASPSGSASPTASPTASPSPTRVGSTPRPSSSPSASPSSSPTAAPADVAPQARSIDEACPEGQVPDSGRVDVDGNTHERAIDCIVWWEISRGTSATQYDPEVGVTRAQMASFVVRLIEQSGRSVPAGPDAFPDDDGSTHEASIDKLAAAGIVAGKADGRYAPEEVVPRAQMASFLVRGYEYRSGRALAPRGDYFADDDGTTHEDNINKAAAAGFTGGRDGRYDPFAPVRRDQMASFLTRALSLLVEEGTAAAKQG